MSDMDNSSPSSVTNSPTGLLGHYDSDVTVLTTGDKTIILVGTAHVSQESVELVKLVIEQEQPDGVCVELDAKRFEAISHPNRWESLDLKEIIRQQQLSTLMVNLVLASFQKRLGDKLGVLPGTEMLEAIRMAEKHNVPVTLGDRDVRVTMRRAWRNTPFWRKSLLMSSLLLSIFDTTEVSEDEIRNLKKQDVLSEMMKDLGKEVPTLKVVLIDERDRYLAKKMVEAPGKRTVAVVGAGHVAGICQTIEKQQSVDLEELNFVPPVSPILKIVGWSIPVLIVGSIAWIGWQKGADAAGENALFWILANGIPSGIGGLLAMAHPLTTLTAFVAAPFTSLTPVIGVGYVTAFVQAYLQPPIVRDFQTVAEDIAIPGRWWKSRLLRVFLAFLLPTIGSIIGTWVGGTRIVSNLF
ncbi:MAG: TraB/GumN family protein [Nitrospirales bacterium]|nr:MAG: TraB/GumN family protein [Nitrospirales bacterium]